jgi:hypothetical protein
MIYVIEAFDKTTDLLVFEEKIPCGHDEKIKLIMGWTEEQWVGKGTILNGISLKRWRNYSPKKFMTLCAFSS